MKKIRSIKFMVLAALCLTMVLVLSACGSKQESAQSNSSENSKTVSTADTTVSKKFKIGMSQCNVGEPYRETQNKQIAQVVKKYPELEVVFKDASQDSNKQVRDIEEFIEQKVDLIIVSPNEPTPLDVAVKKAVAAGIPVIVLERTVNGDSYTQYISMDNISMGRSIGEHITSKILPNGGKVIIMKGLESTIPGQERNKGLVEALSKNKNIEIVDSVNADWIYEKAISKMDDLLKKYPKIDMLIALNDPMAEGALQAAKKAGRDKEIKFVGFDGLPTKDGAMNSILAGRLSASIIYPTGAELAVGNAYNLLVKKEKLEKMVSIKAGEVITSENAKELLEKFGGN